MKQIKKAVSVVLIIALMSIIISCDGQLSQTDIDEIAGIALTSTLFSVIVVDIDSEVLEVKGLSQDINIPNQKYSLEWDFFDVGKTIGDVLALDGFPTSSIPDYEEMVDIFQAGKVIITTGILEFEDGVIDGSLTLQLKNLGKGAPRGKFDVKFTFSLTGDDVDEASITVNGKPVGLE